MESATTAQRETVQSHVPVAQNAVEAHELLEKVKIALSSYSDAITLSLRQGKAVEDIAAKAHEATDYVHRLSTDLKATKHTVPVERLLDLVTRALGALSSVADMAADFDKSHAVSRKLYGTLETAVVQARDRLTSIRASLSATSSSLMAGAHAALAAAAELPAHAAEQLHRAYATLQELITRLSHPAGTGAITEGTGAASDTIGRTAPSRGMTGGGSSAGAASVQHEEDSRIAALLRSPAVTAAREALASAIEEVRISLAHLRQAPVAEKPVVASLEALHLARAALATVASAVTGVLGVGGGGASTAAAAGAGDSTTPVSPATVAPALAAAITAARERASSAVSEASSTLTALRERITSGTLELASTVAASGVDLAVRGAAALDNSFAVTDKVKSLDATYNVTQRVTDAVATVTTVVADINKKYSVDETAAAVLERAKTLDASVTRGYGASITTAAVHGATTLASSATEYAKTVASKYETAKAAYGTCSGQQLSPTSAAAAGGNSPPGSSASTASTGSVAPVSLEGVQHAGETSTRAASTGVHDASPVTL